MASFATGNVSGAGAQHPERFFTLLQANLSEGATVDQTFTSWANGAQWVSWDQGKNFYDYSGTGLYVSGWKLVDANGVEIDPATAQEVFPNATSGTQTQPVTDGPEFVAYGGGWYLNVAPPPLPAGSSTFATLAIGSISRRSSPNPP
jgi:hypothetical protein